jgi:hypothetical protein
MSNLTLQLAVVEALRLNVGVFEASYYGGPGGTAMALLTPGFWAPLPSHRTVYFFLAPGFAVVILIAQAAGEWWFRGVDRSGVCGKF